MAMAAAPALAQTAPTDVETFKHAAAAVLTYPNYTIFDDVALDASNGVVRLEGKVTTPVKRNAIEQRVARVPGVVTVDNQIEVLPVSQFDDQLRYLTARRIYGSDYFWPYASMSQPPIHIVVENGRVTLRGVVNSEVERQLATSLTVSTGAFSVTNELQTDAEVQAQLDAIS